MDFVGTDGWPCDFEDSDIGAGLIAAIRALPNGERLDGKAVSDTARLIWAVAEGGREEELLPRNLPAGIKQTEREIAGVIELSRKLADHIEGLHRPAVDALYAEGAHVFEQVSTLRRISEYARHAYPGDDYAADSRGRPKKVEAIEVAHITSGIYERITGAKATFTSDPQTGQVRGKWPEFLENVYAALRVSASVASQVRAVSAKSRQS